MIEALNKDYVVMKANYAKEHPNVEFLSAYPKVAGYPHIYVLESDGTTLHSQDTSKLEKKGGYDEGRFLSFLAKWVPEG